MSPRAKLLNLLACAIAAWVLVFLLGPLAPIILGALMGLAAGCFVAIADASQRRLNHRQGTKK